ncbi:MAG: hypothetical protein IKI97_13170 [Clostridia bacterium]|nr:hypothetical protein [Clostridia bacterium]
MFDILEKLCKIPVASGMESGILSYIEDNFAIDLEVSFDGMGNLTVLKRCGKENAEKIMLCVNVDQGGFIVNYIEENGYLRVTSLGNPSTVSCAYGELISESGVCGFIVPEKGADVKEGEAEKLYVDIGAKSKEDAQNLVRLGDVFALVPAVRTLTDGRKGGQGVARRLPVAIALSVLKNITSEKNDIYFSFNVQGDLQNRGAKTVAFDITPDRCIVLDICESFDVAGAKKRGEAVLGEGAVILAKSADYCMTPQLKEEIVGVAEKSEIAHKVCVYSDMRTPSSAVCATSVGTECAEICIPARNIGTGAEIIDTVDAENVYSLICGLLA